MSTTTLAPDQPTVYQALINVMSAVRVIGKDDRNAQQGFNFRGIDAVLNHVGPAMREHGVVAFPRLVKHDSELVESAKTRTQMRQVTLEVEYTFVGPGGDKSLPVLVPGEAMDSGDKAYSKAMSVALRTALIQTLAIPTGEKDPDADTYERGSAQAVNVDAIRAAAIDPSTTFEAIRGMNHAVRAVGLADVQVYGDDGHTPTTLGELLFAKGSEAKARETTADSAAKTGPVGAVA